MGIFNGVPDGYEDDEYRYRECYQFNEDLDDLMDDARCVHCRKYLTLDCPHIGEFIDGDGDE